ncbi:hypothetical protein O3P69_002389 [Scylla paramamosain]|uniref:Uncharacterized protein n=1 Tax=Scylla paramamosain TaxID=85552 RepID=A0AAW0V8E8_SCYPA
MGTAAAAVAAAVVMVVVVVFLAGSEAVVTCPDSCFCLSDTKTEVGETLEAGARAAVITRQTGNSQNKGEEVAGGSQYLPRALNIASYTQATPLKPSPPHIPVTHPSYTIPASPVLSRPLPRPSPPSVPPPVPRVSTFIVCPSSGMWSPEGRVRTRHPHNHQHYHKPRHTATTTTITANSNSNIPENFYPVICNGGKLTEVPDKLPDTVEELTFSRNNLPTLETEMFLRWRHLKVLTLHDNQIRKIKPFVFRGLGHLKEISIQPSKHALTRDGLPQNNPLTELPQFSFAGLEDVSQINLSKNRIEVINPYVFAGSRNIGMILLQDNPVYRVRARAFSGLRMAQFLYLPSWVKVIESDAFFDLEGVGLLRLHSLNLHALRPYTFRGLRNVTQISIQESDLGQLRDLAFEGLRNVGELRIFNNKVDDLESLEVREEANVDGVLVRGNHFLHVIKEKPFRIHANDRTVFTENFVPCTCQLWWVLDSPLVARMNLFTRHNYCVSPYPLHGEPIDKVPLHQLDRCPAPQELQLPKEQRGVQYSRPAAHSLPTPSLHACSANAAAAAT